MCQNHHSTRPFVACLGMCFWICCSQTLYILVVWRSGEHTSGIADKGDLQEVPVNICDCVDKKGPLLRIFLSLISAPSSHTHTLVVDFDMLPGCSCYSNFNLRPAQAQGALILDGPFARRLRLSKPASARWWVLIHPIFLYANKMPFEISNGREASSGAIKFLFGGPRDDHLTCINDRVSTTSPCSQDLSKGGSSDDDVQLWHQQYEPHGCNQDATLRDLAH